jgi:hypothetical protein
VDSPGWNGRLGAVTWESGAGPASGTISAANSLAGSSSQDFVGGPSDVTSGSYQPGGVTALTNGNYVVTSPHWNFNQGAVTWGSGTAGVAGTISAANSLVGDELSNVMVGYRGNRGGVTALANGNYVMASLNWHNGAGAVTWGNGATGTTGTVADTNSLVNLPQVGTIYPISALPNGSFLVSGTWVDGATGTTLDSQNKPDAQNTLPIRGMSPSCPSGQAICSWWVAAVVLSWSASPTPTCSATLLLAESWRSPSLPVS